MAQKKKYPNGQVQLNIATDKLIRDRIKELSIKKGVSINDVVNEALNNFLKE